MHFTRMGSYDDEHEVPVIVRGEGCYVYDEHGKRYLDGLSALYCVNIGHGRPELGEAAAAQAKELGFYTNWSYAHPPAIELAARIAELAPGNLNRVFFTSGGSEAVESAWKLAKAYHRAKGEPRRTSSSRVSSPTTAVSMGALTATALTPLRDAVRTAHPRRYQRAEHELLPLAGGPRPAVGGRRDRGGDRVRRARDGRRRDPRAGPERRRLLRPAGRLLPARARDLRPPRRAADLRRGDLLVGPARPLVRLRTLRLPARHDHDRQGDELGLRARSAP